MSTTAESDNVGNDDQAITVGETADGDPYTLPIEELLTGRLFATGKSGAGKSNTGSVIAEELLERGHPVLVVDVDGEYWGLKEEYELLHVGATDECDLQVGAEHAGKLAEIALEQRVPIILDVSGYVDPDEADALVRDTAHELFAREQDALQPFLLLVEEIHEYLPQQGSLGETGEVLRRIAKRGRKRGLGIGGLSQRPADVDKSFITQADLVVWHRLTWENDTDVVKRVVGSEYADAVSDLADGEALVQADWHDADVERVQFRRKRTFDAGATPGLDDVDRPELESIDADLVEELEAISDEHDRRQDRITELEAELEAREARIDELEEELDDARDLQRLGEAFIDAAEDRGPSGSDVDRELLAEKNDRIHTLESDLEEVRGDRDAAEENVASLEEEVKRLRSYEERVEQAEAIEAQLERARDVLGVDVEAADPDTASQAELAAARERIEELEAENERLRKGSAGDRSADGDGFAALIAHNAVQAAVETAAENSDRAGEHFPSVLQVLASAGGGPLGIDEIEPLMDVSETTVREVLKELHRSGVVRREKDGRQTQFALDREFLERRIEVAELDA
jgi:predicted  nucleic acid-binding Zn-ribbon protein